MCKTVLSHVFFHIKFDIFANVRYTEAINREGCAMNHQLIQKTLSLATLTHSTHCYNTWQRGHVFSPIQTHDFDLLFTLEGKFCYELDGTCYISEPRDMIIVPPNVEFRGEALADSYHFFSHFSLSNAANRQLRFQFDDCRVPHRFTLHYEMISTYFDKFFHNPAYSEAYALALKITLIEMILCSDRNRHIFSKTNNFDLPTPVSHLVDYLHDHFKEDLSAEDMAQIAGTSIATLSNHFLRYMSTSPSKYLEKLKMNYAMERLAQPESSIALVAEELRYSDQFAFSKAFKRYSSYSPSEYARRFSGDR